MIPRNISYPRRVKRMPLRASGFALGLVAILWAVSCAPASPAEGASQPVALSATDTPSVEAVSTQAPAVVTQAPAVQPVVTSRGDALEATNPATVNLAAGQLQLIEFFRFT